MSKIAQKSHLQSSAIEVDGDQFPKKKLFLLGINKISRSVQKSNVLYPTPMGNNSKNAFT